MRICIVPDISKLSGGPASFQRKLASGLKKRGVKIVCDLADEPYDAILVINCIRDVAKLVRAKRRGIRIVQRLGVPNRIHRFLTVGLKGYILREFWNVNMRLIRSFIADHVVYQTEYTQKVWNTKFGVQSTGSSVIYNGVDLLQFRPEGDGYQSQADICIISVEGTQGNDLFDIAINLGRIIKEKGRDVELLMLGDPWRNDKSKFAQYPFVNFKGFVDNFKLPQFFRGATLFISTDIITAACPNSVIESLACGTPVLGYNIGPLPELLTQSGSAGLCVECEEDPLRGRSPGNLEGLANAALQIIERKPQFARAARKLAEKRYDLERMCDAYMEVLLGDMN